MVWAPIPDETPIDPSGLKPRYRELISNRAELNIAEANNVRKALLKYLGAKPRRRTAPFDLKWAKKLHKEMFGDVWKWAGVFRTQNLNLDADSKQIENHVYSLLENLPCWNNLEMVEQAARLHYEAVSIHPFLNGNGRWARLIANIWLKIHDHALTFWPDVDIGTAKSPVRGEYISALQAADHGDFEPLLELHRRFTGKIDNS